MKFLYIRPWVYIGTPHTHIIFHFTLHSALDQYPCLKDQCIGYTYTCMEFGHPSIVNYHCHKLILINWNIAFTIFLWKPICLRSGGPLCWTFPRPMQWWTALPPLGVGRCMPPAWHLFYSHCLVRSELVFTCFSFRMQSYIVTFLWIKYITSAYER